MTISTTTSKVGYNGNGVTTAFSVPFLFLANADLTVVLLSSAGVETTLTLSTHYTVTGAGNDSGGTLTMITPPAVGERLTILREVALTQETDYISGDPFPAETHERALDRLTMIDQQQKEVLSRAMRLPVSDAASAALPTKAMRAGKYLAFDVDGNAVAVAGTSSSIVVTPFMEGLLDDANATSAQSTLDVPARDGTGATGTWNISINGNAANVTGTVTIANGGTGATTAAAAFSAIKQAASETETGVVEIATTAEAQAGTDTTRVITPNKLRDALNATGSAPVYACRAWVNFNGTGTVSIRASGNVSSITDLGTGLYRVNFTTAMDDTNYCVIPNGRSSSGGVKLADNSSFQARSTSNCTVATSDDTGSGAADVEWANVAIFR